MSEFKPQSIIFEDFAADILSRNQNIYIDELIALVMSKAYQVKKLMENKNG